MIILADDAGYRDFGFQGSREISTPNIDALARQGIVYSDAYASMPFCSPSRAGLLTGRYTQRFGYEFNLTQAPPKGVEARFMGLDTGERTAADLFRAAGYATYAVGKWHVGEQPQFDPRTRGFDHFYGFLGGGSSYFPNRIAAAAIQRDGAPETPGRYLTDQFGEEAARDIEESKDRPFLLYLAFNAVHAPMDALAADEARFPAIKDPQRRRLAAMSWALDRAVGKVIETLRRTGADRNTLIVFANDNGGDRVGIGAYNTPLRGTKGTLLEGGIRVPLIVRLPDRGRAGTKVTAPVSLLDVLPTALELSGAQVPQSLDGLSLLSDPAKLAARPLYWRYDNMAAMRDGRWKLLRYPDRPPELYDLVGDIGETRNLADADPERVRSMMKRLFAWEGTLEHPRWHTGTFWSQEDVRRYSADHVAKENIAERKALFGK
ncbi:sulfatase-like hydrolase/transferase [Novosphingobium sp. Gsoil 351]|uniref:sulfatase-like hydrolase/transferase n=1 Tax=Novosphingobium sp. Gsoil 351 TaxID=2675225 RepID=UPI0018A81D6A|nr:sulfatase-like hydrolase/transferase [Novosphingobium sp. Gsoil 351]